MRLAPSFFVALRNLTGRADPGKGVGSKNHLVGAAIGVALSIIPLTVVLLVADGMIQGITARYIETSTYHLQASPYYSGSAQSLEEAAARIASIPAVALASPEMQGPAVVLAPATDEAGPQPQPAGAVVRAIMPELLADTGFASYLELKSGELAFKRDNDVLLGEALARKLHVGVGQVLSLVTNREGPGVNPKLTTLRVRGIVSTGYEELDSLWALVHFSAGERILAPGSRRVFVGIKTKDAFGDLAGLRRELAGVLSSPGNQAPDWSIQDWKELESNLWRSFSTTRALLVLIMALAVAVAAINVGSSLIMLALERKKDIAILKSCGCGRGQVSAIFVASGAIAGSLGTILGLAAGTAIAVFINQAIAGIEALANLLARFASWLSGSPPAAPLRLLDPSYYLQSIPVRIHPLELVLIAGGSILLCVLASLYPASRASRLPPMEIFRKA
jgi:lipoprotein-releasing system permease protein